MKFIAPELGRSFQPLVMEEVRPFSGVYAPALHEAVVARYGFVGRPDLKEAAQSGAKFQHGHMRVGTRDIIITELGIYTDGVIVNAFNTADADAVMDDLIGWATETFSLRKPLTIKPRSYTSNLVIEFDRPVDSVVHKFTAISRLVSKALNEAYGWDLQIELFRLALSADPASLPVFTNTQFFIERRVGSRYAENRYYSGAPLKIEHHLRLLEEFEKLVAA